MRLGSLIIFFTTFFFNNCANLVLSQENQDSAFFNYQQKILQEFNNLEDLNIGYYGTTQNCQAYNVYGFKYKKTWMLIADQNKQITFLITNAPRVEQDIVSSGSNFLFMGLGKNYANNYLKFKKRRKVVKDLEIYGFYKFNRHGKKAIKGLLLLDYPNTNNGLPWPLKWISEKAIEAAKATESLIPELETEVSLPPPPLE